MVVKVKQTALEAKATVAQSSSTVVETETARAARRETKWVDRPRLRPRAGRASLQASKTPPSVAPARRRKVGGANALLVAAIARRVGRPAPCYANHGRGLALCTSLPKGRGRRLAKIKIATSTRDLTRVSPDMARQEAESRWIRPPLGVPAAFLSSPAS